jgi:hypothetical protein
MRLVWQLYWVSRLLADAVAAGVHLRMRKLLCRAGRDASGVAAVPDAWQLGSMTCVY